MRRRTLLAGLAGIGSAAGIGGLAGCTFRWHAQPPRYPALTNAHLQGLADLEPAPTRVLFVGNSMVLHHDLPELVAARAADAGHPVQAAMAAGQGARLIETLAVDSFREALRLGWDVLVLQDYSGTPLRAPDRWGSAYAMRAMAKEARARGVLLYPTWAFPPKHGVYHGKAGFLARTPENPADFAEMIIAYYEGLAEAEGWVRAPVTEALLPDATPWLADDIHHLNAHGAELVAGVIWESLKGMLA